MLDFGRKVKTRHFYVLKTSKSLSKKEIATLRKDIPADIQKHLQRGSLPYIKLSSISEVWAVEFSIGTSMYEALDNCTPVLVGDHYELRGVEGDNVEAIAQLMFTDTTLLGDEEYLAGKLKLRDEFISREAKRRNEAADAGKTDEQLRKESEEAIDEVMERDKHAATILEMGEQVKKEESEVSHDEQH